MKPIISWLAALLLAALPVAAEEFTWSWEQDKTGAKKPDAVATKAADPSPASPAAAAEPAATPRGAVDTAAYNDLLKENLSLRKQLEQASGNQDSIKKENERLAREVRDMEARIQQFTTKIDELKKEKAATATGAGANPDKVVDLESQLATAEREKQRLAGELATLKAGGTATPAAPSAAVQPGSDLFKQVEKENAALKEKLAQIQNEKQQAAKEETASSLEQEQLKAQLAQSQAAEKKYKEALTKVLTHLPSLEKDLSGAQSNLKQKDMELSAREKDLQSMQGELEVRERRLLKAERILALLAKTRLDVLASRDMEERDLHYNMALVYQKEGRNKDAEDEYLRALRLDPNDASAHYNLAILYDDVLDNKARAVMHYRKYLTLNPHAPDVDKVRDWLMSAEMH